MNKPGILRADWMSPVELRAFHQYRAERPTILKPWRGECLVLRSEDRRLPQGEPLPVPGGARRDADADGSAPAAPGTVLAAERIVVDADLILRLCTWPELPELCHMKQASALLGVSYSTVGRWVKEGLLLRRRVRGQGPGNRWYVSYRPTSALIRRTTGRQWQYPEAFFRGLADPPSVAWVIDLWRNAPQGDDGERRGRRQSLVRIRSQRSGEPPLGGAKRWEWLCPTCGRRCYQVYVPAGPMARRGMTWQPGGGPRGGAAGTRADLPWFCCWMCTGVLSEGGYWSCGDASMFHRYLLKLTGGIAGRHEFARILRNEPLPGED